MIHILSFHFPFPVRHTLPHRKFLHSLVLVDFLSSFLCTLLEVVSQLLQIPLAFPLPSYLLLPCSPSRLLHCIGCGTTTAALITADMCVAVAENRFAVSASFGIGLVNRCKERAYACACILPPHLLRTATALRTKRFKCEIRKRKKCGDAWQHAVEGASCNEIGGALLRRPTCVANSFHSARNDVQKHLHTADRREQKQKRNRRHASVGRR